MSIRICSLPFVVVGLLGLFAVPGCGGTEVPTGPGSGTTGATSPEPFPQPAPEPAPAPLPTPAPAPSPTPPSSPVLYTVSGSLRDAFDFVPLSDSDVCCVIELTTQTGERRTISHSHDTYTFKDVPAGSVKISVRPYLGYSEQARDVTLSGNAVVDFALRPLPVRVRGELLDARTEARPPRCTGVIEVVDGPDAGRTTSPTPPPLGTSGVNFEFSELLQPTTVTFRFSAPGGYETKTRSVRLRGLQTGNVASVYASLACPNCPLYSSMTCP
jgi:hypothetical protein